MPSSTPSRIQIYGCDTLPHNSVDTVIDTKINTPPMVGVPALAKWVFGPSLRMACPALSSVSLRMVHGPSIRLNASAVSAAITARKVVYWKMFSAEIQLLSLANHKSIKLP